MARDKIHEAVKNALIKDGWNVTDDPLILLPDDDKVEVDLGAEKIIIAEKGLEKIAVEIKAFNQPSIIYEFHRAIGQYFNYQTALIDSDSDRELFIAIPDVILQKLLSSRLISKSIERMNMKFVVVNLLTETIVEWRK
jgi:XisH protein